MQRTDTLRVRTGYDIAFRVHHIDMLAHNGPHFLHNGLGSLPRKPQRLTCQFHPFHLPLFSLRLYPACAAAGYMPKGG